MSHPIGCACQLCADEEAMRRRIDAKKAKANFTAQCDAAAVVMARWDETMTQAAAASGLRAVRGTGAMVDCVFLMLVDPAPRP